MNLYNIYCPDRRAYWKTLSNGYTSVQSEAGVYEESEADEICDQPHVLDYKVPVHAAPDPVWIHVDSWKDVPVGIWIVKIENSNRERNPYQIIEVLSNVAIIGHHFAFDENRVIAYKPLGETL